MRDEDTPAQENFIMGFNNPVAESVADKTDAGTVTVLGYRPLGEDARSDGVKGKMAALVSDEKVNPFTPRVSYSET